MVHIKKLVMYGFKSFPRKTEIPFTPEINIILGPNGSGKSNVMDALCFVLGRLSIKSIRAAKAKNLIFMGTKAASPAKEAMVEIVFDNSDKTFSIDNTEVSVKRIVKKNGQSAYKINNHLKTRQEVLTLLAQAGIDPHGFNIILQGEIQNFVRMHTEERRKIIEEVSGISVYEVRKGKSLRELEKTEEKLKEINAVLKERTSYLNNLEKERHEALRYKKLEKDIEKYKVSIVEWELNRNKKESENVNLGIEKKNKGIKKIKKLINGIEEEKRNFDSKIVSINSTIQESTGIEQEKLNREITNLRAELAGINVNIGNYESKMSQIIKQKHDIKKIIQENEFSIKELQKQEGKKETPKVIKKQEELDIKKKELGMLERRRKRYYIYKSELKSISEKIEEEKSELENYNTESDFLIKQIRFLARELFDRNTNQSRINTLKFSLGEKKQLLENILKREKELEKRSYGNEYEMDRQANIVGKISKMDICPLCKSKITEGHIDSIHKEIKPKMDMLKKQVEGSDKELGEIYNRKKFIEQEIEQISVEISKREADIIKISNIKEKERQIKNFHEKIEKLNLKLAELDKRKSLLERKTNEDSNVEQKYETLSLEIQEISLIEKQDFDSEIIFKKRELERVKISLKQMLREEEEVKESLVSVRNNEKEKHTLLEKKKKQEEELSRRFQKLILDRDEFHKKIRDNEIKISTKKNDIYNVEQEINNLKIEKAKIDAGVENLESEKQEYEGVEIVKGNKEVLSQKLARAQDILSKIGTVNLRSLEVYGEIKKEYDSISEKVETIFKEKEGILRIIHQIDIKKKKTFLKSLNSLNEIFSRNFSHLSTKGQVWLELENKKDPFEGGVNIIVKTGHGKYFDVKSLSGGEQTIVALSLIFAIQELNPYCFYVLDEIDAALDKRNSERLAHLLNKYMEKGQYIIITHNDEVISNADTLYGVSMHDGVSKIISLKV